MHWIKAEIHEYILKNWRLVKVATTETFAVTFETVYVEPLPVSATPLAVTLTTW